VEERYAIHFDHEAEKAVEIDWRPKAEQPLVGPNYCYSCRSRGDWTVIHSCH